MAFSQPSTSKGAGAHRVIAAIDIGASKVVCLIASVVDVPSGSPEIEIIGVGQQGITLRDARKDTGAASEAAMRVAIEAAERMAGEHIRKAFLTVHGRQLLNRRIGVDLDLAGGAVTQEDVQDCLDRGAAMAAQDGAVPLHALPVSFVVDGDETGANPCGLVGDLLTTEMLGVGVRGGHEANLRALLEHCDIIVERLIASPLAAAETVLIEDEKDLGCLMVDIGARSTDFAVFEQSALVACGGIKVGGEHITRDIAQIFGGSIAHAERIKALHGSALTGGGDDHRFIDFPQLGETGEVVSVSRAELSTIIAPRLEEILTLVFEEAVKAVGHRSSSGLRRAVLTGGGSLLTGTRETAERIFGVKTRLGRPTALSGAPDAATAPQFSACIGALLHAAQREQRWSESEDFGLHRIDNLRVEAGGILGGVTKWMKANF